MIIYSIASTPYNKQTGRASLQSSTPNYQISTPVALFEWAEKNLRNTTVLFSEKAEYSEVKEKLKARLAQAKRIPDTQKNRAFIQISKDCIVLKKFSFASDCVNFKTPK